ncbi:MAG: hypothetical protein V3S84_04065 [Dehalococcoidales bacterium]
MNERDFLMNYLWPSDSRLNTTFTHPLPNIEGLKKCGDFIVQSELEDTFATTIMTKYESDTLGVRLVDVYRNTQHEGTGVFVRLVGTMSLVKTGYPRLSLDAGVSNVNLLTAEREDLTTRVRISLPQADPEQGEMFFNSLGEQAKEAGISFSEMQFDALPDFYGPIWVAESKGVDLDIIRKLRDYVWSSYKRVMEQTKEKTPFDYRPFQEHMIFNTARREHLSFKRMGLSVAEEAQAAFFSVLVSGV